MATRCPWLGFGSHRKLRTQHARIARSRFCRRDQPYSFQVRSHLSSPGNPQFDPTLDRQPVLSGDPLAPTAPDLLAPAPAVSAPVQATPPRRDPVWSGWDVLLLAVLTVVTMIVLQLLVLIVAMLFVYPHSN